MAYDDLPLHGAGPGPALPNAPPPSSTRWIVVGAVAVIAGSALALWWMSRAQPESPAPGPTAAVDRPIASTRPSPQQLNLPALAESDTLLRDLVSAISRHPLIARLLVPKDVVRAITLSVVQIADGRTPTETLAAVKPIPRLQIIGTATGRIDPTSYERWNNATTALISVNTAEAAQTYVNVKPLFDEAYRELGHKDGNFDDAIVRAIRTVMDTPDLSADPLLLRRTGSFEHDDPALRGLLPVQKQLILLGPENHRRIVGWLRQLATSLELKVD